MRKAATRVLLWAQTGLDASAVMDEERSWKWGKGKRGKGEERRPACFCGSRLVWTLLL